MMIIAASTAGIVRPLSVVSIIAFSPLCAASTQPRLPWRTATSADQRVAHAHFTLVIGSAVAAAIARPTVMVDRDQSSGQRDPAKAQPVDISIPTAI
jgi:hypothetical protein